MRLLAVLEHGRQMPSAWVRALNFRQHFEQAGYDVTFVDHYTDLDRVLRGLNRVYPLYSEWRIPFLAAHADVVYLCKVTSLKLIARIRQRAPQARIVLDFGDALWLFDRRKAGNFETVLAAVDFVTTDNEYTAEYVRRFNPNCLVVPDCPQCEVFDQRRAHVSKTGDGRIVLGWVGSPSTTYNLFAVWEALERLFAAHPQLELRLLGADPRLLPPFEKVRYTLVKNYDQARMVDEVLRMHIGLFPLQDTEACRVRGVLKATVYMSGEAVAVCSPIGECTDLIEDGINGMLAGDTSEWIDKIGQLIGNDSARNRIAQAGLETVRRDFTLDRSFARMRQAFEGNQSAAKKAK